MNLYHRVAVTIIRKFSLDSTDLESVSTNTSPETIRSLSSASEYFEASDIELKSPRQFQAKGVQINPLAETDFDINRLDMPTFVNTPLTWISNGKGADEHAFSLEMAIKNLGSPSVDDQVAGIKALRGRDSIYHETQGYVLLPHLLKIQSAVKDMQTALSDCAAVFGIDRGGGMLVSYLKSVETSESTQHLQRIAKTTGDVRKKLVESIGAVVLSFLSQNNSAGPVTLGFVETFISGSSVNTLVDVLKKVKKNLHHIPNLSFKIVALRQTLGVKNASKIDSGIPVTQIRVPYLLAEDVNYQLVENGDGRRPVVVVTTDERSLPISAQELMPKEGFVARDLMVALVSGKLNDCLGI
jgi:hypothetical protein